MSMVVYEVWGEDTFAREDYLVGVYKTRKEAEKALRASERSALSQCAELRDTYWIIEMTPEGEKERREQEREREYQLEKRRYFNYSHLCELVVLLNSRLLETLERDKRGLITEKEVMLTEKNTETDDCYSVLSLSYNRKVRNGGGCLVCVEVEFKEEGTASKSCFVGTPDQVRKQFSMKRGEMFVLETVERLVVEFYR